jgi:hypothetical protein
LKKNKPPCLKISISMEELSQQLKKKHGRTVTTAKEKEKEYQTLHREVGPRGGS